MSKFAEDSRMVNSLTKALDDRYAPKPTEREAYIDSVTRSSGDRIVLAATINVNGLASQPVGVNVGAAISQGDKVLVRSAGGAIGPEWELVRVLDSGLDYGATLDTGGSGPATPTLFGVQAIIHLDNNPTTIDYGTLRVVVDVSLNNPSLSYVKYVVQWKPSGVTEWREALTGTYISGEVATIDIGPIQSGTTYNVRVAALDLRGVQSDWSTTFTLTTQSDSIATGIAAITAQKVDGFMRITWTISTVSNISGYNVYSATDSGGTGAQFVSFVPARSNGNGGGGTQDYDAFDLSKFYAIRLLNEALLPISVYTPWVKDASLPTAPSSYIVEQRESGALLSWTRSAFQLNMNFDKYRIYRATAANTSASTAKWELDADHFLFPGSLGSVVVGGAETAIYYGIATVDKQGVESAYTWQTDTTPPPVPTGLSITSVENGVSLVWNAINDQGFKEYIIYTATAPDGTGAAELTRTRQPNYTVQVTTSGGPAQFSTYYAISSVDWGRNESAKTTYVLGIPRSGGVDANVVKNGDIMMLGTLWRQEVGGIHYEPHIVVADAGWGAPKPVFALQQSTANNDYRHVYVVPSSAFFINVYYSFSVRFRKVSGAVESAELFVQCYDTSAAAITSASGLATDSVNTEGVLLVNLPVVLPSNFAFAVIKIGKAPAYTSTYEYANLQANVSPIAPAIMPFGIRGEYFNGDGVELESNQWVSANTTGYSMTNWARDASLIPATIPPPPDPVNTAVTTILKTTSSGLCTLDTPACTIDYALTSGSNVTANIRPAFLTASAWVFVSGAGVNQRTVGDVKFSLTDAGTIYSETRNSKLGVWELMVLSSTSYEVGWGSSHFIRVRVTPGASITVYMTGFSVQRGSKLNRYPNGFLGALA